MKRKRQSNVAYRTQVSHFPQEIIQEILSRLPVKTLTRFKSVCKSWKTLISDPHFFKLHLKQSLDQNRMRFIFIHNSRCSFGTSSTNEPMQEHEPNDCADFLASCNGLFCVRNGENDLFLWNPSTRECKRIPGTTTEFPSNSCTRASAFYGLGYHSVSDDYNLVRISLFESVEFQTEVKIYSRKTDTWRRIKDFPYDFPHGGSGVFVNEALHWMVSLWNNSIRYYMVAALDVGEEDYRLIKLPDFGQEQLYSEIAALGENLVLFSCSCEYRSDIWILKEYGKMESWTRINVVIPSMTRIETFAYFQPLCLWKTCEILIRTGAKKFVLFDFKQKKCTDVLIQGMLEDYRIVSFVESLVSPN